MITLTCDRCKTTKTERQLLTDYTTPKRWAMFAVHHRGTYKQLLVCPDCVSAILAGFKKAGAR
jgi:hypothetical protein